MDTIQEYVKRPTRYMNVDGLNEVVLGVFLFAVAASLWLGDTFPHQSLWHQFGIWLWIPAWALASLGVQAIRKRITYPRTGFMKIRRDRVVRALTAVAGAIAAAFWVLFIRGTRAPLGHAGLISRYLYFAIFAVLFGVAYGIGMSRQAKWKWIVGLLMACGALAVCLYPGSVLELELRFFAVFGVAFVISGGISFYLYLRHTEGAADRTAE